MGFSDTCIVFKINYELQLLKWLFIISSLLFQFNNPSKRSTLNKTLLSGRRFKATPSAVYAVDMTNDFERFLNIVKCICTYTAT